MSTNIIAMMIFDPQLPPYVEAVTLICRYLAYILLFPIAFLMLLDAAAYVTFRTLGVYARRVRVFNKDKNMITSTPNKSLNKPLQSSSSSTSSSNSSSPLMKSSSSSSSLLKSSYSNSTLRNANNHNNSNNNNNNEHIVKTSGINKHCLRTLTNNFKYNSNDVISNKNDNDKDFRHNQPLAAA